MSALSSFIKGATQMLRTCPRLNEKWREDALIPALANRNTSYFQRMNSQKGRTLPIAFVVYDRQLHVVAATEMLCHVWKRRKLRRRNHVLFRLFLAYYQHPKTCAREFLQVYYSYKNSANRIRSVSNQRVHGSPPNLSDEREKRVGERTNSLAYYDRVKSHTYIPISALSDYVY